MKKPLVSIVIPTFNRIDSLTRLLKSLRQSDYPTECLEIVIVDNADDKKLSPAVKRIFPKAKVITPGKNLYSNGGRRVGGDAARGDYIFLLDDDNTLNRDCIGLLIDYMENNPKVGITGPLMLYGDTDTIWCGGGIVTPKGTVVYLYSGKPFPKTELPQYVSNINYFPNACMVRKDALKEAPLDDVVFPHNWAEPDFCLRVLQEGYGICCVTAAVDRHHIGYTGHITRISPEKMYDQAKSRIFFRKRHLKNLSSWLWFWVLILPLSTVVYFWNIIRLDQDRKKTLWAYFRGTFDGFREQPLPAPINSKKFQ